MLGVYVGVSSPRSFKFCLGDVVARSLVFWWHFYSVQVSSCFYSSHLHLFAHTLLYLLGFDFWCSFPPWPVFHSVWRRAVTALHVSPCLFCKFCLACFLRMLSSWLVSCWCSLAFRLVFCKTKISFGVYRESRLTVHVRESRLSSSGVSPPSSRIF